MNLITVGVVERGGLPIDQAVSSAGRTVSRLPFGPTVVDRLSLQERKEEHVKAAVLADDRSISIFQFRWEDAFPSFFLLHDEPSRGNIEMHTSREK